MSLDACIEFLQQLELINKLNIHLRAMLKHIELPYEAKYCNKEHEEDKKKYPALGQI